MNQAEFESCVQRLKSSGYPFKLLPIFNGLRRVTLANNEVRYVMFDSAAYDTQQVSLENTNKAFFLTWEQAATIVTWAVVNAIRFHPNFVRMEMGGQGVLAITYRKGGDMCRLAPQTRMDSELPFLVEAFLQITH